MSNIILINNANVLNNLQTLKKLQQKIQEVYYKQSELEIQDLTLRLELVRLKQEEYKLECQIAKEVNQ